MSCADQGRKFLLSSYFIVFSLPNTYVQIRPDVILAWSSAMPLQARLDNNIPPWLASLNSDITPFPMSPRQHHRQHDSAVISHHDQRHLSCAITSMLGDNTTPRPMSPK
jgi:hypothetical protein